MISEIEELQQLKDRGIKLFKEFDFKLRKAREQQKGQMIAYHVGNISTLFKVFGRTKENKALCPNWLLWHEDNRNVKKKGVDK